MEIMAMVRRGEKPSNIREINDMRPNPNQPLPTPQLAPRPKPWKVSQRQNNFTQVLQSNESSNGISYNSEGNGFVYQTNGENAVSWWQKNNVKISEIENEYEVKTPSPDVLVARPFKPSWLPPQPPPVVMPEAAAAIRYPKKSLSQKSLTDDQLLAVDELQRITKISEAGGVLDTNGLNSDMNTESSKSGGQVCADCGASGLNMTEIQEEQGAD